MTFSNNKKNNGETHLKCCCTYVGNASITQKTAFMYVNGFIFETFHIYKSTVRWIISSHRNINNSKLFFNVHEPVSQDNIPKCNPNALRVSVLHRYNVKYSLSRCCTISSSFLLGDSTVLRHTFS